MYIFEDEENGDVVIDSYRVKGFIERESVCQSCGSHNIYSIQHNALFCPICNEWSVEHQMMHKDKPLVLCSNLKVSS